ncbi:hypothetical protein FB451DRAFT_1228321 [Mycena latifolia]|nr:hypothetical protein FB451DRAFT_1321098 [Mycena latifolia]KAJ7438734.1 hypothetical protein FB451DRAFT_1303121 [Mycena latifolia]KAJ7461070.1 hypothetical protein FB451DRAFT_1268866 [Mycena latifolia]KAJ7472478.1 hypothetical protein FB451DRAFT_1249669 [Mycena latifolia]KAJ7486907.1 hypothetical protein FB451DRAFT_1228321 [Mycena latifolia]
MSSFNFDTDVLDPALLAEDPAQSLLTRVRNTPSSQVTPSPAPSENDGDAEIPTTPLLESTSSNTPSLVAFGRLVKRKLDLSDASSAAFDQFCQPHSVDERQVLIYAQLLGLQDISKKNEKFETWSISADFGKKISAYVKAFVYSPTTISYRGLNVGEHIMKAMRECKVNDLPAEDDLRAVDLVLTKIRDKGTQLRNIYKTKVKESMEKGSTFRNVATLSHKLLKNTGIKATVQFYQRAALVRWCIASYPGLSDEEFWPRVDTTITTFRKQSSSDVELDKCFNAIYEEDKKTYGDPADTEYKTVDDAAVSGWQATLIKHAKAVQPTPQQAQGAPPQKRRRIEVDGGSNASDGEDQ